MSRYIDAEELKRLLNKSYYYDTPEGFAFSDMICECKTTDVQEVKHGKWLDAFSSTFPWKAKDENAQGFYTATCSNCHISQSVNVYKGKIKFSYCPYCGAKMDGEKNETV